MTRYSSSTVEVGVTARLTMVENANHAGGGKRSGGSGDGWERKSLAACD